MQENPLQVPQKVRRKAASLGESGRAWLNGLPRIVGELEREWRIAVGQAFRGGTEAFAAAARLADGRDAVLKIAIPGLDSDHREARVLRAAGGRGYARLIAADETRNAMLLERLGVQLHALGLSGDAQLEQICATLREAWMALPEGEIFTTGAEKAAGLARFIEWGWNAQGKPCAERTVALALDYAGRRRRAFDPAESVLVHGDAHAWNTLRAAGGSGYKFIDPDGVFAERAFDLAIPMREWGSAMPAGDPVRLGRDRCRLLAGLTGVAEQPVWEWGLIQCVANGLALTEIGFADAAAVEFGMADAWAAGPAPRW
jgi:streptomycin 6-kinase